MKDEAIFKSFNGIDVLKAQYHRMTFSKHVHEGFTLSVIDMGAQRFSRTGSQHIAGKDSMVLINADQVHTGQAETEGGWRYQAIYPSPETIAEICTEVLDSHIPYFPSAVIEDKIVTHQFREFHHSFQSQAPLLQTQTLLHGAILALVVRHSRSHPRVLRQKTQLLDSVRDYLQEYYYREISLEQLSALVGLSTFHLVRQFKIQYGLSPHAYQIQLRIKQAQRLLKTGLTVAQTAAATGFHDQSHLHRHFLRALGATPGKYRAISKNVQAF